MYTSGKWEREGKNSDTEHSKEIGKIYSLANCDLSCI
jgi:hypothetical protein